MTFINGLMLIEEYITEIEENELIKYINSQEWNTELSRRVQHYGYKFPELYTMTSLIIGNEIPDILLPIIQRLNSELNRNFDQIIVNEYKRGQGINQHIDKVDLFGDTIVSLSLGSRITMNFNVDDKEESLELKRRSLLILQDEARYLWRHSIKCKNNDNDLPRETRISITFRTKL